MKTYHTLPTGCLIPKTLGDINAHEDFPQKIGKTLHIVVHKHIRRLETLLNLHLNEMKELTNKLATGALISEEDKVLTVYSQVYLYSPLH